MITKAKIKSSSWEIRHPRAMEAYGERRCPTESEKNWPIGVRRLFARLRTGHAVELNSYAHRIGLGDSPDCQICKTPETTAHVLMECIGTTQARQLHSGQSISMADMVSNPETCRKILQTRFPDLEIETEDEEPQSPLQNQQANQNATDECSICFSMVSYRGWSIQCTICQKWVHGRCSQLSQQQKKKIKPGHNWACPKCP